MNAGNRTYSIKDLENFCGIKAHTIRMWEKRYGILNPERSDSNIRFYTEEELKKLLTVSILNRNGLKISRIARLSDAELLHEVMKNGSGDERADGSFKPGELIMTALRFSEEEFREKLKLFIDEKGMEKAYTEVFYPVMQKARALWLTDCISKPQEQFIRHVIRNLIITEERNLELNTGGEKAAIVNMADTEPDINLIYIKYLLKRRGLDVIYTESKLSEEDIKSIHSVKPFSVLAINLPASEPDDEIREFCRLLGRELGLRKILVTGRYDSNGSWSTSNIAAVCSPAGIAAWADTLTRP